MSDYQGKRAFDVFGAGVAGLLASPVILAAGLSVLLFEGRPVWFRQERLGLSRRPFLLCKIRTMDRGTITRTGRLLRGVGIDELPQLIHVLSGDMSLVGPRPLTEADVIRLGWNARRYDVRWSVRPGLTGPGQLRLRGRCHARVTFLYDRRYAERSTWATDLHVVAATPLVGLMTKTGARRMSAWAGRLGTSFRRMVVR